MKKLLSLAAPLGLACIGFLIALTAAAAVESYDRYKRRESVSTLSREYLLGQRGIGAYIVVQSFDAESRTLVAYVYSVAAGQYILMRMRLSPTLSIERRNARIENDVIVGTDNVVPADTGELKLGTRGMAMLTAESGKPFSVNYILIGDPFPRP